MTNESLGGTIVASVNMVWIPFPVCICLSELQKLSHLSNGNNDDSYLLGLLWVHGNATKVELSTLCMEHSPGSWVHAPLASHNGASLMQ